MIVSPWSVRAKLTVRVGVKTWWIGPTEVFAFIVNVGRISKVYAVAGDVPVIFSYSAFIASSSLLMTGGIVMSICVWLVVVGDVAAVWCCHVEVLIVCVRV